jgi:hypothetical protein
MFENKLFRIQLAGLVLIAASLACNINTLYVDCNPPDLIAAINSANAHHT